MSRYTVTVTQDDPRGGPKTVARVDTSSGTPLVTELVVTAADGGSLPARPLPLLDIIAAVAALAPSAAEVIAAAARASATVTTTGTRKRGGRASAAESGVAKAGASRAKRSGAKAANARSAEPTTVRAEPTKPARSRARAPKMAEPAEATPASAARGETARVYRRMPDPAELVAAFRKAGSVRDLVQQYDVPRHTMNGWLARLRQQGLLERRQAR